MPKTAKSSNGRPEVTYSWHAKVDGNDPAAREVKEVNVSLVSERQIYVFGMRDVELFRLRFSLWLSARRWLTYRFHKLLDGTRSSLNVMRLRSYCWIDEHCQVEHTV